MSTSKNASGKPRSLLAQVTAPKITTTNSASLSATITRLSVKIPWRLRLMTPASVETAKSALATAAIRRPAVSEKK